VGQFGDRLFFVLVPFNVVQSYRDRYPLGCSEEILCQIVVIGYRIVWVWYLPSVEVRYLLNHSEVVAVSFDGYTVGWRVCLCGHQIFFQEYQGHE